MSTEGARWIPGCGLVMRGARLRADGLLLGKHLLVKDSWLDSVDDAFLQVGFHDLLARW